VGIDGRVWLRGVHAFTEYHNGGLDYVQYIDLEFKGCGSLQRRCVTLRFEIDPTIELR